ncbi:nitroreductase family protein [Flavobacterium cellulosilyticum]|uniref:Nitroreductase family protein n=1 Tax=Flavobacterium cellulosilyticum TaxID=2541731 RepID=A0A4R5CIW9_9FLAO|nr:nitroreductase family protein [Flavobacterium cellulosilyticum]TDD97322.1 nitroreductase family protein [Flavobacterium cellulosilyticum]
MSEKKLIEEYPYISYQKPIISEEEMLDRAATFYNKMDERRSVREFSDQPIPLEVIENLIKTASTAPSVAHKQPWTFCIVENPEIKKQIRIAAEAEELEGYESRMSSEWLVDLKPLGTGWHKPFLETAPYLIIIFKHSYELGSNGQKKNNYYVQESVGIATGFLLAAIHNAGLVALTHTPNPMGFLSKILNRPENEKPFLLIPVGYPASECWVPDIKRKELDEIAVFY